jgi:hypothetical protein
MRNHDNYECNSGRTPPAIESIAGEYTTVLNFRPRRPHDSVSTHELLFNRSNTFYAF